MLRNSAKYILTALFSMTLAFASFPAWADVTPKDVQTIVRTIGFLENAAPSNSVIAVVYDPANSESLDNAKEISDLLTKEVKGMQPRLISVSDMSDLRDANFAFVTSGMSAYYKKISAAMQAQKIVSFSLTRSCIDQDCCTVYINSTKRVEIVINKKVADLVKAQFKPVFLMMVSVI